jgi:hypothetical protein
MTLTTRPLRRPDHCRALATTPSGTGADGSPLTSSHATVSTAIAAIERSGTWKMEVRSNTKAELVSLEQQMAALSRPSTPRPAKALREALAAERVPVSVWQDSQECKGIQESAHFAKACAPGRAAAP